MSMYLNPIGICFAQCVRLNNKSKRPNVSVVGFCVPSKQTRYACKQCDKLCNNAKNKMLLMHRATSTVSYLKIYFQERKSLLKS